jgi:ribosome-associated toxin RatA of RatAB toxin-antitoxin module
LTSSIRAAALAVIVLAPMTDATGGEFHVTSHTNDSDVVVEGTARLDSDMITAWQVLTDYGSYTRFVPGLRSSRVLRRQGDKVAVEQRADVGFGIFHEQVDVIYEISEHAPAGLDSRIISGCDCGLESSYTLIPSDSGVVLAFKSLLSTGTGIRATFQRRVGERSIRDHFHAIATEMERRSMLARSSTFPEAKPR